ncbi:YceI family protein [Robiginitalea sp. SC105]|uniref:YceI family protein n=1 Tax=Robiginitalea sp. SC105 TaxID=2762332 RepID=UPI00163B005C|nr:YceI family protein [Robiginitalea sp. SC105]MBC2840348.1 YceI family protein [Robiginitalea sp. SC105]
MKSKPFPFRRWIRILVFLLILPGCTWEAIAQEYRLTKEGSELLITGTSTLHDWEIVAEDPAGSLQVDATGELPNLKNLHFSVVSESLKSGKESMDKNTYKALETDKYEQIVFRMVKVKEIKPVVSSEKRYKALLEGDLTIAGKTKRIDLECVLTLGEGRASLKGKEPLKMTEYGIDPPKALLGTIKTGDDVEIHFNTHWKR